MEVLLLAISLLVVLILPRIISHYLFADRDDHDGKEQSGDSLKDEASRKGSTESQSLTTATEETNETNVSVPPISTSPESSENIINQSAAETTDSSPGSGAAHDAGSADNVSTSVQTPNMIVNNFNQSNNNNWRCACEGGFLPPGMLQSLGGAEAAFRMSTGQCYHKKDF